MRKPVIAILILFLATGGAGAVPKSSENQPVEITSTGETTYKNGMAIARDNVAIHIGDTDIYADFAQYNSRTHDISLEGNVRIYRDVQLYLADRTIYNTETKEVRGADTRTEYVPYFLAGQKSVHDFGKWLSACRTRLSRPTIHRIPTFISGRERCGFTKRIMSFFKTSLFTRACANFLVAVSVPISRRCVQFFDFTRLSEFLGTVPSHARLHFQSPTRSRGAFVSIIEVAVVRQSALNPTSSTGKNDSSWAKLKTYYIQDQNPLLNRTSLARGTVAVRDDIASA